MAMAQHPKSLTAKQSEVLSVAYKLYWQGFTCSTDDLLYGDDAIEGLRPTAAAARLRKLREKGLLEVSFARRSRVWFDSEACPHQITEAGVQALDRWES